VTGEVLRTLQESAPGQARLSRLPIAVEGKLIWAVLAPWATIGAMSKTCSRSGVEKPPRDFYKQGGGAQAPIPYRGEEDETVSMAVEAPTELMADAATIFSPGARARKTGSSATAAMTSSWMRADALTSSTAARGTIC
jgi:hypothetical protein